MKKHRPPLPGMIGCEICNHYISLTFNSRYTCSFCGHMGVVQRSGELRGVQSEESEESIVRFTLEVEDVNNKDFNITGSEASEMLTEMKTMLENKGYSATICLWEKDKKKGWTYTRRQGKLKVLAREPNSKLDNK